MVWCFLWVGIGSGQTLSQLLQEWSTASATTLEEEDLFALEDVLRAPPVLDKMSLELLSEVGWVTAQDRTYLESLSLPVSITQVNQNNLSPELRAFLKIWAAQSQSYNINGRIVQSQRLGKSDLYRWRSAVQLSDRVNLDVVMDRSAGALKVPSRARRSLTVQHQNWDFWLGDLQVRLGSGLFSAGSFPTRIGLESISTFQRWNFSLRSHRSAIEDGRISGGGCTRETEGSRWLAAVDWGNAGQSSILAAWAAPSKARNWGGAFRIVDSENLGWEGSVFGQARLSWGGGTGEVARDRFGNMAEFLAIQIRQPGIGVLWSVRYYTPGFQPLQANPPRQINSLKSGEMGIYQGIRVTRFILKLELFLDAFRPEIPASEMSVDQGLRVWMSNRMWSWRLQLDWNHRPLYSEPEFTLIPLPITFEQQRLKFWVERPVGSHFKTRIQINETQIIQGGKRSRGQGIKWQMDYLTQTNEWTLESTIAEVNNPSTRVYFWKLNLPYEMGTRSWSRSGVGLEGRLMHQWNTGTRFGFRIAWIKTENFSANTPQLEGALIMDLLF